MAGMQGTASARQGGGSAAPDPSANNAYFYLQSGALGTAYISSPSAPANNPLQGLGGAPKYNDYLARAMGAVGGSAKAEPEQALASSSTGPPPMKPANGASPQQQIAGSGPVAGSSAEPPPRPSGDASDSERFPPVITDFKPATPTATTFPASFPLPDIPAYYPAPSSGAASTYGGSAPASLRMLARGSTTSSLGGQSGSHTRTSTVRTSTESEEEPDGTIGMLLITEFPDWEPPVLAEFKNPVSSNRSLSYADSADTKLNKQSLYLDTDTAGMKFERFVRAKWDDPLGVAQGLAWRMLVSPVQWAGEKVARQLTTTTNPRNHEDVLRWMKTLDINKTLLFSTVSGALNGVVSETVHTQLARALKNVDGDNIVYLNAEELERRGLTMPKVRSVVVRAIVEIRKLRLNLIRSLLVQPLLEQAVRRIMELPQLPPEYEVGIQPSTPPKANGDAGPTAETKSAPPMVVKAVVPPAATPVTAPAAVKEQKGGLFKGRLKGAFSAIIPVRKPTPTSSSSPLRSPSSSTPNSGPPVAPSSPVSSLPNSKPTNGSPLTTLDDFDPNSRRKSAGFRLGKMPYAYFRALVSYAVDQCYLAYARDWETSSGRNLVNNKGGDREEKIDGDPITLLKSCFVSPQRVLDNLPMIKQCVHDRCAEGDMGDLLKQPEYWGPQFFKCGGGVYDMLDGLGNSRCS